MITAVVVENMCDDTVIYLDVHGGIYFLHVHHYRSRYGFETTHYGISQDADGIKFGIIPTDTEEYDPKSITYIKLKNSIGSYSYFYSREKEHETIAIIPHSYIVRNKRLVGANSVSSFGENHGTKMAAGDSGIFSLLFRHQTSPPTEQDHSHDKP